MPLNVRAFLAAIENHYPVVRYIKASGDPRLVGVLDAIAKITSRESIDCDPHRVTGKVTFDLKNVGLTFISGDRPAIMPLNLWSDVEASSLLLPESLSRLNKPTETIGTLGLADLLDVNVPLNAPTPEAAKWKRYAQHEAECSKREHLHLTVRDVLTKGKVAPLTKDTVMTVHTMIRTSATLRVLGSDTWPVNGSLGDLLLLALSEVDEAVWDQAFGLDDLTWLLTLIQSEVPRTYSILPEREVNPLLLLPDARAMKVTRAGVSSGFLNPDPTLDHGPKHHLTSKGYWNTESSSASPVYSTSNFPSLRPPPSPCSGVIGRNVLFLGVQSRKKFLYKHELRDYVLAGKLELHVAFSRDSHGLVYDPVGRDLVEK
ncbi:hypothetical protein PQX77_015506 [Marasmius sp. AFHP31]|nr:hypothetical protein PQX77_015506 [Marasmius sp. AFHP31]